MFFVRVDDLVGGSKSVDHADLYADFKKRRVALLGLPSIVIITAGGGYAKKANTAARFLFLVLVEYFFWIPAFAGMTVLFRQPATRE